MQLSAKEVKSFIDDSIDFLNKINDIKTIKQDAILVTMDFRSRYSNNKHNKTVLALVERQQENSKNFPSDVITTWI